MALRVSILKQARGLLMAAAAAAAPSAHAQSEPFPSKPIRMLIGAQPGGGLDTTARAISDRLSAALGQPIIIDHRPSRQRP